MLYREKATPSYKLQIIDRRGAPIHPKSEIFTTSSWYHDIFFIHMPEHLSISTLPDIPKNTSDNRATNSTVAFLKRIYCPQLINTHDILKGWKIEADEGPKAFAARTINEEMEAVLIQGCKTDKLYHFANGNGKAWLLFSVCLYVTTRERTCILVGE